jgi:hypothetical protein
MLVRQIDKQYRADLTFFRNATEVFTCWNETAQAISLDDYDLVLSVYDPTDPSVDPVFEKVATRENQWKGRFTVTKDNAVDDYSEMPNDKYTYQITWRNKNNNQKILQQQGTLTINNVDENV